jgi:hypothetical protein
MQSVTLTVPARFSGPPGYANGGWIAGMLAQATGLDPIQITLRSPVPLETELTLTTDQLFHGETLIAEVAPGSFARDVPPFVQQVDAIAAESITRVRATTDYGDCLVCGVNRPDGYQLHPGPIEADSTLSACRWRPPLITPALDPADVIPATWAAMDCPGVWTVDAALEPMLLGRMTGSVSAPPHLDEDAIVVGQFHAREGRKMLTSTAIYSTDGALMARAEQVWISVTAVRVAS